MVQEMEQARECEMDSRASERDVVMPPYVHSRTAMSHNVGTAVL